MTVEMVVAGLTAWTLLSVVVGLGIGRWLRACEQEAEMKSTPPLQFRRTV